MYWSAHSGRLLASSFSVLSGRGAPASASRVSQCGEPWAGRSRRASDQEGETGATLPQTQVCEREALIDAQLHRSAPTAATRRRLCRPYIHEPEIDHAGTVLRETTKDLADAGSTSRLELQPTARAQGT
eukprot:scaffold8526_cov100-Isochrysis_galbana.AAC.2